MLHRFWLWLLAGSPQHYWWFLVVIPTLLVEWILPRVRKPQARSILEMVANGLLLLFRRIPALGPLLAAIGTPVVPDDSLPKSAEEKAKEDAPKGGRLDMWLLPLLFCTPFLQGCAYCKDVANVHSPRCQLQRASLDCAQLAAQKTFTVENASKVVSAIVANGPNWIADLEVLAATYGEGGWEFVVCEAAALKVYFENTQSPKSLLQAPVALERVKTILAKHPRTIINPAAMLIFPQ